MKKYMKGRKGGAASYIVAFAVLGGVWEVTDRIKVSMANVPIQEIPRATSSISAADVKSLPWVWEKSPAVLKHEQRVAAEIRAASNTDVDVEAVFGQKTEIVVAAPPPKVEFDKFFKENVRVQAVANNGAVLNGQFYELGTEMAALTMTGDQGVRVVPFLRSVSTNAIVVRVGKKEFSLPIMGESVL